MLTILKAPIKKYIINQTKFYDVSVRARINGKNCTKLQML